VGKALAFPKSLTQAEKYEVLCWSDPDKLHATIHNLSGLNTPSELLRKARTSRESLTLEELDLITGSFQADGYNPGRGRRSEWVEVPGNIQALALISAQEGIEDAIFRDIHEYSMFDIGVQEKRYAHRRAQCMEEAPGAPPPPPTIPREWVRHARGPFGRDGADHDGKRDWPAFIQANQFRVPYPQRAPVVFGQDMKKKENLEFAPVGNQLYSLWDGLSEEEKADYEARSEVLRQAAWDESDERDKKGIRPFDI
jgi:hypothetical protein